MPGKMERGKAIGWSKPISTFSRSAAVRPVNISSSAMAVEPMQKPKNMNRNQAIIKHQAATCELWQTRLQFQIRRSAWHSFQWPAVEWTYDWFNSRCVAAAEPRN